MSMFSELMGRIFGDVDPSRKGKATAAADPAPEQVPQVDVAARLDEWKAAHPEGKDLDWRISLVDLMKLAGMDSSYGARKKLAKELGYSPEDIDSKGPAEMNIWLHRRLMAKLAENGGAVPAELLP